MKERCYHDWEEKENKIVCKLCGADRLKLKTTSEGLKQGITETGKVYSVRDDRNRYFFPEEWINFFESLKDANKPIFDTLINSGARIEEALNITPKDFDWDRRTLKLRVTKIKAAKGETIGKSRTFVISSQYSRRMKKYIVANNIKENDRLFTMTSQSVWRLLRRKVKKLIKDWYNFSLHNIRKTHGMYLVALGVQPTEIIYRLGHDYNTFIKHYGSPNIFNRQDKLTMLKILGDVYNLQ